MQIKFSAFRVRLALLLLWLAIVLMQSDSLTLIAEYGAFSLLGVIGAIFANATGAGGGVVFIPFFNQLNFDVFTSIATSFAIQCCGMTAGAITWWSHYRRHEQENKDWQELLMLINLTVPFSVLGIGIAQWHQFSSPGLDIADHIHMVFGVFSILLAIAIFATIGRLRQRSFNQTLAISDYIAIPAISFIGGIVTAWLSIGVGELIAVYLIIRRFNVTFAIAVAVILSAFSVWAGVVHHALLTGAIYWPVVLFAGAGAIVGGILARYLVLFFSATNLKIFFAGWVLLLGITALPI